MNVEEYATRVKARRAIDAGGAVCAEPSSTLFHNSEFDSSSDDIVLSAVDTSMLGLVELILKNRRQLHQVLRNPAMHAILLPRLLAIALTGFVLFGVIMSLVLSATGYWPSLMAIDTWIDAPRRTGLLTFNAIDSPWGKLGPWVTGKAFALTGAYAFGLVAASGVALPSLYFYCLLAGVRMSMLEVVVHAVKAKAVAAVGLIGILPIYVAIALGFIVLGADAMFLRMTLFLGLALPFIAGFAGTVSLYQGFSELCGTMPADRAANRECFLRRLVLSWSACYTAIMPVMIYSLWEVLSR